MRLIDSILAKYYKRNIAFTNCVVSPLISFILEKKRYRRISVWTLKNKNYIAKVSRNGTRTGEFI